MRQLWNQFKRDRVAQIELALVLIMLFIVFFKPAAKADSVEYILTSVTSHLMAPTDVSAKFTNKISADGRVNWTPLTGVAYTVLEPQENGIIYHTYRGFFGLNSIGQGMAGGTYAIGGLIHNTGIGLVAGGYMQDSSEFEKRDISLGTLGNFIPVIGFEVTQQVPIGNNEYLKFTNTVTAGLINHAISWGKNF